MALILVLFFLYFLLLWRLVHGWTFVLLFLSLLNFWALLAYHKDISLPFAEAVLAKEYLRVKEHLISLSLWTTSKSKFWLTISKSLRLITGQIYKDILKYLLLLFLSSQRSFDLFIGIKFDANKQTLAIKTKKVKQSYEQEFLDFHKTYKKKVAIWSLGTSTALTIGIILIVVALPSFQRLNAMTFGWTQTDWSGLASPLLIALHPDDKTTWTNYYSKSANLTTGTSLTAVGASTSTTDTLDADFQSGTTTNAYSSGGKVTMLKPSGATCSTGVECSGGACLGIGSICFNCGVDTVAGEGGPYDANGTTQTTGGYYRTVLIGNQCWFKDNLNVGTMISGALADNTTRQDQTDNGVIEKWCYAYKKQDDAAQIATGVSNCNIYGGLYQWPEAVQYVNGVTLTSNTPVGPGNIRGICPSGWHVPSHTEFITLANFLGGYTVAGGHIKSLNLWNAPNTGADNSSGFTALAGGRAQDSVSNMFVDKNTNTFFITTTLFASTVFRIVFLGYTTTEFQGINTYSTSPRLTGYSVRCLAD
ncbi:hypothetical protein COT94_03060 [Candidatus Falkowbacteria bacterium CG10_big_fil_rev_8_21_14_0_10_37_14]|uniref:Fibrobacter succinogenes major paralogous domain-containing protein n=1 Tax=Candidatus Falkowbacteria bacterium CG10_big_fil_rev_8_21_14_0_10_37_14 TaxID=1974561 RepID=A0A2M6WT09_9BACT|nr:hypothetical protein [Candidatus Falkowbacteria bacterium]PIT95940.1 MAG: hypothetical protein COT94_03060 [Candidatus Falkowbacteria bacterium CG10_big_fil_rev_8_21_14_0_10_37_14]